ncbi:MAG: MMPL family transporter [Deltaproteobacteria bacterium]|nr:MMPL family transporter [Deltaproteobacteria bacterium]MBT6498337.1 MMPL family transporter [Deltaproteobacteria bacterium]
MKMLLNNLGKYFETVPDRLRRKKLFIWIGFLVVTVFLSVGIPKNTFDMSLDSWFSKDDPVKLALNHFKNLFGSDDVIYLVYKPKDSDLFSKESLEAVIGIRDEILNFRDKLSEGESSMLSHITKVDSIASAKILKTEDGALVSRRFIGRNLPANSKEKAAIRQEALKQKTFPLFYFSEGFQYGAIMIQTDLGTEQLNSSGVDPDFESELEFSDDDIENASDTDNIVDDEIVEYKPVDMTEYVDLMDDVNDIIMQPKYRDHLEYYPVGTPPMMKVFMQQMDETGPLFLAMIMVIFVLLWVLFRSLSAVIWSILLVIVSCVWTMGISGWLGNTITTMVSLTIMFVLAVGIADAVHIISGYLYFRKEKREHEAALRATFRKAALPCLLTTLTTMIGMLTLTLSSISHIQTFGYMSALGVGFAFGMTIFVLPLMLDLWAPARKETTAIKESGKKRLFLFDPAVLTQKLLNCVLPVVEKSPMAFIGLFMLIFLTCIYGGTKVKIDSNLVKAAKEGTDVRINYEVVDTHMAGTQTMEIYIDGGSSDSLMDPRLLQTMDKLQRTIETKYEHWVARTFSLVDIVKDAYQLLNEGQDKYYTIPDDGNVLAQTLFMFNNANPEDRRRLVSDDYRHSHISVSLYNAGSFEYTGFFKDIQRDIDTAFADLKNDFPELKITVTGSLALLMKLVDYISWSQIKSLGSVILIISLLMIFIFGSIRVGVLSIIPNLIPATLTFGLLGLLGIALDSDTIVVAPVVIGIAVDDTIHFITHYRDEVIRDGDVRRAVSNTIQEVGQAISFTTLILGMGFFMLTFSTNTSFIKVGAFGSLAIFMALLCDLFMLPALILIFKPKFLSKAQKQALATV